MSGKERRYSPGFDDLYSTYDGRIEREDVAVEIADLSRAYRDSWQQRLTDMTAIAGSVAVLNFTDRIDPEALTGPMKEAFHLAFPNMTLDDLSSYSGEALDGLLQPWKGKLFEVSVRDQLNQGQVVGDYHLEPDQTAVLAVLPNQPGYDLIIQNSDGSIAELVQLKSTDTLNLIHEAMAKYPDFAILTTADNAGAISRIEGLSVADIHDEDLENILSSAVNESTGSGFGVFGLAFPFLPVILNAYWVGSGQKSLQEGFTSVALSAASIGVGVAAAEAGGGLVEDAIGEGIASTIFDVGIGLGFGLLARMLGGLIIDKLTGEDDRKREAQQRAYEARQRQKAADRENAIQTTWRRIDDAYEEAEQGLKRISMFYPGAAHA
jgi:hypothetical protein